MAGRSKNVDVLSQARRRIAHRRDRKWEDAAKSNDKKHHRAQAIAFQRAIEILDEAVELEEGRDDG